MTRRSLPTRTVAIAVAAMATVAAVGLSGCGSSGGTTAAVVTAPRLYDLSLDPAAAVGDIVSDRTDVATAESIRARLEQDLLWHGISMVQVMRFAAVDHPEIGAWTAQLDQNTLDLTAAIGLVFGPDAARAFHQQWAQQTQFLVDYAAASGDDDQQAAGEALAALRQYTRDAGSFFATVTDGRLRATKLSELLDTHVDNMIEMIRASIAGRPTDAIAAAVVDGGHLASIGHVISVAVVDQQPVAFPGSTETPAAAQCTIVTTQSAAYLVSAVMTADDPEPGSDAEPARVAADAALAATVGMSTEVYLGLDIVPISGGTPSVAAAARLALDRAASASAASTG